MKNCSVNAGTGSVILILDVPGPIELATKEDFE